MALDQSALPWIAAGATLGSALVGGSVALGTTWLANHFAGERESRKYAAERATARRAELRGKLEQLVTLVLDYEHGLSAELLHLGKQGIQSGHPQVDLKLEKPVVPSKSFDQAEVLQALYFPQLRTEVAALRGSLSAVRSFMTAELALMPDTAAWKAGHQATYATRSSQSMGGYLKAERELFVAARRIVEQDLSDPS